MRSLVCAFVLGFGCAQSRIDDRAAHGNAIATSAAHSSAALLTSSSETSADPGTTMPAAPRMPTAEVPSDPNYPGAPQKPHALCDKVFSNADERAAKGLAECATLPAEGLPIRVYSARFSRALDARLATDAYTQFGIVTTVEPDHIMDGGYRGLIHIVPEWPPERDLSWVKKAFESFRAFEIGARVKVGKSGIFPRYRMRNLELRYFRSEKKRTPTAYAIDWRVAYNLSGSLFVSAEATEETLVHEIFHVNDQAHGQWSHRTLEATYATIVRRCGTKMACLAPYAPGDTVVRGGTYYAFQPGNDVREYAAELAIRYYREQKAVLAGKNLPAFKCRMMENKPVWDSFVHEFFDDVDLTAACP